jgi:hypothetical protein
LRSGAESYQQPTFSPGRQSHSRRTSDPP